MRTLLAMTCAAVLSLAACGTDDGTDADASSGTTTAADDTGSDPAAADSAEGESSGDESSGEGSSGEADEDGSNGSAAANDGDFDAQSFCAAMAELDTALELDPPLLDPSRTPEEVEQLVVDVETRFDTVVDTAPSDLQPDWVIVNDAFKEMTAVIRDADFVVADVDPTAIAELGADEEAFAAGERLPSEAEYCGT